MENSQYKAAIISNKYENAPKLMDSKTSKIEVKTEGNENKEIINKEVINKSEISDERINDLVNLIINKKFTIQQLENGPKKVKAVIKNQEVVEPTKEFKGVFTDFITNELIKTPEQATNFLKLVYGTISKAIKLYIKNKNLPEESIIFLYKGGNILRFLFQEVTRELPYSVSKTIETYYKDSFKRSDADFSVFISPQVPDYEQVYIDISNLLFLLENQIRNVFMEHPMEYFEFFKLNERAKKNILEQYLVKLNETTTIKDKLFDFDGKFVGLVFDDIKVGDNNVKYDPKQDFMIAYVDKNTQAENYAVKLNYLHNLTSPDLVLSKLIEEEKKIYGNKITSSIFESSNEISFSYPTVDFNIFFNLIRIKWSVNALFDRTTKEGDKPTKQKIDLSDVQPMNGGFQENIRLDGELIDITIPRKEDSTVSHFFEHLHQNISTYTTDNFLEFTAPGILYLADDLERVLFKQVDVPWLAPKYEKRIKRLCFMYLLILFLNFPPGDINNDTRITYMKGIKAGIFDKIINDPSDKNIKINLIDFLKNSSRNMKKNPFRHLIINTGRILINPNADKSELVKYIGVVNENINKMIEIIDSIHNFINSKAIIREEELLHSPGLSGGSYNKYYKKYIKYKQKYTNL